MPRPDAPSAAQVAAVRRFNRFYTARARLLADDHLGSAFSLGEVRLLYELAHRDRPTASELCRDLNLDAGYVSRILASFRRKRLVARTPSPDDRRQARLALTAKGRKAFAPLERQAGKRMREMLAELAPEARAGLVRAMATVQEALAAPVLVTGTVTFRAPRPGDLGWIVQRHGELYWDEWQYDQCFEALVATIVGDFMKNLDPDRERCWIAELDGERVGSVFLVKKSETTAKLRLLLVEPSARGHGIGAKLVRLCTDFARSAGYSEITLWTQSELVAARKLYVHEGYQLVDTKPHEDFGKPCVAETWTLGL
jgi:DNA-binding MarR family transcriptional regulator/N-acetylglutamate synthase-like GNAT family acetyltransferase